MFELLQSVDDDGSGAIELEEFIQLVSIVVDAAECKCSTQNLHVGTVVGSHLCCTLL